jgi:hypothetical protein
MEEFLVVEEEEEMEEVRSEELLVGLPEGIKPRCAMTVVPPGISSGTARTSECSGKALRVPVPKTPVHPLCA